MAKPDTLIVDGHALSWQHLCDLRRQQIEAWKKTEGRAARAIRTARRSPPARRPHGGGALSATKPVRQSGSSSKAGLPVTGAASLIASAAIRAAAETAPRRGCSLFLAACAAI